MNLEEYSESELLRTLALDVDMAFPRLMEIYDSQLHRFIINQVGNQHDAEDIMQDGWIRVFQALNRYSEEQIYSLQLRGWLFTIFRNLMYTYFSRKKKTFNTISIEDLNDDIKNDWVLQPEDIIELKSRIEEARAEIEQLPPACRAVLALLLQGLNYSDIAEELKLRVNTVRAYASRGMKLLNEKRFANISERR